MNRFAALELVEAGHQLGDARFARAGVADQRHALAGANVQVEVRRAPAPFRCSESRPARIRCRRAAAATGRVSPLDHRRLGVDEGKDAFGGAQRALELAPEGGQIDHGKPELAHAVHEEKPGAGGDGGRVDAEPADIEQDGRAQAAEKLQGREEHGQHKAALDMDRVALSLTARNSS